MKTNIGHLDAAAGVAGLIKAVLALEHRQIPPSLHFEQPNPQIDFASSPFFVNTALRDWDGRTATPRRAGVSSLGIGGTNAHVVLEEAPPPSLRAASRPWQLLLLSARTPSRRWSRHGRTWPATCERSPAARPRRRRLHPAGRARGRSPHRRALVCRDAEDAVRRARGARSRARARPSRQEAGDRPVAFLFPGQGAQYPGMGRGLYETRAGLPRRGRPLLPSCSARTSGSTCASCSSRQRGTTAEAAERLRQTALAQPALFVVEYALARLWMQLGRAAGRRCSATASASTWPPAWPASSRWRTPWRWSPRAAG